MFAILSHNNNGGNMAVLTPIQSSQNELTRQLNDITQQYVDASQSDATRQSYSSDWREFEEFCITADENPLPAEPETVARFLSHQASIKGLKVSTIERRISAINDYHRKLGKTPPTKHTRSKVITEAMQGIKRQHGEPKDKKAPATDDIISRMLSVIKDDTLEGYRDRALIAFGFASAMRRAEIVNVHVEDLQLHEEGLVVFVRTSKTDKYNEGDTITLPHGRYIRPIEHLMDWLRVSGIESGPVFRPLKKGGKSTRDMALSGERVNLIVKKYAAQIGLNPDDFGAHSFRSGYITTAAMVGAPISTIMAQSRHKTMNVVQEYFIIQEKFKNHSGAAFL